MPPALGPGGCRIWFEEGGAGDPLLLIGGAPGNLRQWSWQLGDFQRRYRVIVYDQRGVGKSDAPFDPHYSMQMFAADAIAVLDAAGVQRAHVYGVSNGGRVAQRVAIAYPERVGALVLGCTSPGKRHGVPRPPEVDAALRAAMADGDASRRAQLLLDLLYTPAFQASHPDIVAELRARNDELPPREVLALHYAAAEGHEAWDELPSIRLPGLVLHGTEDPQVPVANARLIADRIPGAELHLVEGARHGYQLESHPAVTEVVVDFLARHPIRA